ncbi:MAG TPA: glycoside hydrolase [Planctomycetes bacterium]|nr:glycoside hydrolase [Planctomycetota bacterium]
MQLRSCVIAACLLCAAGAVRGAALDAGWEDPPVQNRLRAYWWWLNGCVTRAAITRDLEEMKKMGWGGALICDAGGAEQDGNDPVPHGPTFLSPEWMELYAHALREAHRLGLEMSLNIQSGWNLGGPTVTADDAAKKLVWSEARVTGPGPCREKLPEPPRRDNYYRDLFVLAYPIAPRPAGPVLSALSAQAAHPAAAAGDGDAGTFWVSGGAEPGEGPSREKPQWLALEFAEPVAADSLAFLPRKGYGPREFTVEASDDGAAFRAVASGTAAPEGTTTVAFERTRGRVFRLVVHGAFDPLHPDSPRNVQIAEFALSGEGGARLLGPARRRPIQNLDKKALHSALNFSAPDTTPLLVDVPGEPGEEDARAAGVRDLTASFADGVLAWDAPEGEWQVLRFGCTIGDRSRVSTSSDGWKGYALDVLDAGAFRCYWDAVVEPLIAAAGPLAGTTLKYLHTDSWEIEAINWTAALREEFRARRGYDMLPFLPVVAGRIIDSRDASNRFLHDLRRTIGDCAVENHYRPFRANARKHGLQIHPESGGPHAVPVDAQQCLGYNDVPMSEFWAWSWRHRIGDDNRFFVKQPASAAHTYGRRLVAAEGFTTIGPHWQETIWDNLKPAFDKALCEGLNLLFWHAFVCSPDEMGLPGIQYFAGTHFNPGTTWWPWSRPFIDYINRCQWMLAQGLFVADVCRYYGDHVPNFAQHKATDPAGILPGYDYDVVTADVLTGRMRVANGRLTLPDGMSYRLLVLPDRPAISLPVLSRIRELVAAGATVAGARPERATGLAGYPESDAEAAAIARDLWGPADAPPGMRVFGKGRVFAGVSAREVLRADGLAPDFEVEGGGALDYIHRRDGATDIFFVANRPDKPQDARCIFRVAGKAPELWNPVTGERSFAAAYEERDGRTAVPLGFPPCGSWFVVFREGSASHPPSAASNDTAFTTVAELRGPWQAAFDPAWGGPAAAEFPELVSFTERPEPGIRFYSGRATYRLSFERPETAAGARVWLDLGAVRELAEVRLNGERLGIVWAPPFRVEITAALKPGANALQVDVVNFWPNRIIGDAALAPEKRLTRTNVRKLVKDTALMPSGLLGPVRIVRAEP